MTDSTPRGIRNCNPGNIRKSPTAWLGEDPNGEDPDFVTFKSPLYGIRALAKILWSYQDVHGINTVSGFINRWAPPGENDTTAYVQNVCAACEVSPDTTIDLKSSVFYNLVIAIITQENGEQPYAIDLIAQAISMVRPNNVAAAPT